MMQQQSVQQTQQQMLQQTVQQQSQQTTIQQKIAKAGVVDEVDLEAQKRREYEEWFKCQEKEAMEYSACVKYHEKAGERDEKVETLIDVTDTNTSITASNVATTNIETHQITNISQSQELSSSTSGFSYGAIPTKGPQSQPAMPPMSSSSMSFESSQSQQFSSVQQSSSSSVSQLQQSSNQVYESQEFNGGAMKGYRIKGEEEANHRDSGIFTGINGDANSLVDDEFDYKKHTVKDLAKHFALVKPKQNIPHNILPEQRMFNGDHAPQLNYLGANEAGAVLQSNTSNRREVSQQDIEASKAAYELKKKQQLEQQQQQVTSSSSSTVVRRTEASSSSTEQKTERRMSLRDSLMLDPAKAHLDAGLIDPSAILRGSDITGRRSTSEGMNQSSVQGETDKVLNKWDNHNTIARGWTIA